VNDQLIYEFQLADNSSFTGDSLVSSGEVAEGENGSTSWQLAEPLNNHKTYYWRCRAIDNHGDTEGWGDPVWFLVNQSNSSPASPVVTSPLGGIEILKWHLHPLDHDIHLLPNLIHDIDQEIVPVKNQVIDRTLL